MKHTNVFSMLTKLGLSLCALLIVNVASAQFLLSSDSAYEAERPMTGRIWGYAFGDYYYKANSDSLNRGGGNEYTGVKKHANAFAIRRIYLGYDFNFNKKFSAHLLLAAEDWNSKSNLSPYIKLANVQWHNIFKGSDLIVGELAVPTYTWTNKFWSYRSIEKELIVKRGIQTHDLGVSLKGTFDRNKNFGYQVAIGNGSGSKAETNNGKKFYGNIYGKFLNKKLVVDLYADYNRFEWTDNFHHAQNMIKLLVGYQNANFSAAVEGFIRNGHQDAAGVTLNGVDTVNISSTGISAFVRGKIIKNKLGFFARMDIYNPDTKYNEDKFLSYDAFSSNYNPNTKEKFVSVGLDYTPIKNVHFMPNIWYNSYQSQRSDAVGATKSDHDLVYRMTFYFVFGK